MKRTLSQRSEILNDIHEHSCLIDTREIFLHSYISNVEEEPGIDYRMSIHLQKNLRFLETINHDPILIHLYSEGGHINYSFAIYDSIRQCNSHVVILGYGCIASGGTIILQAADTRLLMPRACFMIHYGYADSGSLNSTAAISYMNRLKIDLDMMLDIYVQKCKDCTYFSNQTPIKVRRFLERKIKGSSDFYMSSAETLKYGFIDGIVGQEPYNTLNNLLNV